MTSPTVPFGQARPRSVEELYNYFERLQNGLLPFRRIQLAGPIWHVQRVVTAASPENATDDVVIADASGGAFAFTLLTALGRRGRRLTVKRISAANNVTITPAGAETIDGAATLVLAAQWAIGRIESDGLNWLTV